MIVNAYTIYDRKALTYSPPFFAVADGAAVRMFQDLAGDNGTQVGRHPGDFVLYRCGAYDDASGSLLPVTALQHIVDALALVSRQSALPFDPEPGAPAAHPDRLDPTDTKMKGHVFNGGVR